MSPHPELDQLSAYVDDELPAPERSALESHLPSCADCRATLDALRATLADLTMLPEAVPTEQDSWALRSAIARARAPVKRWHRAAWAAGAVAAAAIAVVAIVRPGANQGSQDLASRAPETAANLGAGTSSIINFDAGAFTQSSAHAKLLVLSGKAADAQITNIPAVGGFAGSATPLAEDGAPDATRNRTSDEETSTQIGRCVDQIQRSTQEYLSPVEYDVVTYDSKPAFLLFFQTGGRYELWVVERPSCNTLYFAQAA